MRGGVYVGNHLEGYIQNGQFVYKTKDDKIWIQVVGGLPSNQDYLLSSSTTYPETTMDIGSIGIGLSSPKIGSAIWNLSIQFSGDMSKGIKESKRYNVIQKRRSITYTNRAGVEVSQGMHTLNYIETIKDYNRDMGKTEDVSYISVHNIGYSIDGHLPRVGKDQECFTAPVGNGGGNKTSLPFEVAFGKIFMQTCETSLPVDIELDIDVTLYYGDRNSYTNIQKTKTVYSTLY